MTFRQRDINPTQYQHCCRPKNIFNKLTYDVDRTPSLTFCFNVDIFNPRNLLRIPVGGRRHLTNTPI